MYNFSFIKDEILIEVFDNILIRQNGIEKNITLTLTDKRVLLLDYVNTNLGLDALRIAKGVNYTRYKEVFFCVNLNEIEAVIDDNDIYKIILKDKKALEFYDDKLYQLMKDYCR